MRNEETNTPQIKASSQVTPKETREDLQWAIFLKIRALLKEYSKSTTVTTANLQSKTTINKKPDETLL
jgi:hypothetical protein